MAETRPEEHRERVKREDSQIIGFRLPVPIAKALKTGAARRQIPLNALLVEMWELYQESKRAV